MRILSSAFEENQHIPSKYTCQGENINPELSFTEVPNDAKSLVLIMDDPDTAMGTFVHWLVYNIDPKTPDVEENSVPDNGTEALNGAGKKGYIGPCPPSGTHRYFFKLYALNIQLKLSSNADKKEIEEAMNGHILDQSELVGLYQKNS